MRKILTVVLICFAVGPTSSAIAQVVLSTGASYRIQGRVVPQRINNAGDLESADNASTLNPLIIYLGSIRSGGEEYAKFSFLEYDKDTLTTQWLGPQPTTDPYIWAVPEARLVDKVEVAYATGFVDSGEVVAGIVSLPVKLRTDPFNFSGNIALGPALAWRWRTSPTRSYHLSLLTSAGISSVQLTPSNTGSAVTEATDRAAYYWTFGLTAELAGYQIGFFVGKDYINGSEGSAWEYQGDRWFSLGIGTAIFGGSGSEKPTDQP